MAETALWPIEGQFDIGAGFLVAPDCLGQTFESRMKSHKVWLTMPDLEVGAPERPALRHRPWRYNLPEPPSTDEAEAEAGDDRSDWGSIAGWNGDDKTVKYAHIRRCGFRSEVKAADAESLKKTSMQPLAAELATWWDLVCDWLDVLTLQHFTTLGRTRPSILQDGVHLWSGTADGTRVAGVTHQHLGGGIQPVEVLDRQQLQAALDLAGNGTPPATEWLFVRDARSFLIAGDYRRSVIDACTATELSMVAMIDRQFDVTNTPQPDRKREFKNAHGLAKLKSLHKKVKSSETLPKTLINDVAAPRNRAAHKGAELTRSEAVTALNTASSVVHLAFPLPTKSGNEAANRIQQPPNMAPLPQEQNLTLMNGNDLLVTASIKPDKR